MSAPRFPWWAPTGAGLLTLGVAPVYSWTGGELEVTLAAIAIAWANIWLGYRNWNSEMNRIEQMKTNEAAPDGSDQ